MDKRRLTQIITSIVTNANFKGFFLGKIYRGDLKKFCVPGLNCYSCPGALGSCPIGSLQAVLGSIKYHFSFYVLGFMSLMGIIFGRFICGWLCPFGLFQDLLNKIPSPKIRVNKKVNHILKYGKYIFLFGFVIIMPLILTNVVGMGDPYFCKYVCPAGTIEGGVPLVLMNEGLRSTIGWLFGWKVFLSIATVIFSILIYRPFCRYICPLGAFYSFFNPISFYRLKVDENKCTSCKVCSNKCKLDIEVYKNPNSLECIRCGECVDACPTKAIEKGYGL
ncbi:MAG: 4Fe-4S binding protein [Marinisporobacter sp.]|nr:4Fe-4S binding protein [Marinisporobacter sp.]